MRSESTPILELFIPFENETKTCTRIKNKEKCTSLFPIISEISIIPVKIKIYLEGD